MLIKRFQIKFGAILFLQFGPLDSAVGPNKIWCNPFLQFGPLDSAVGPSVQCYQQTTSTLIKFPLSPKQRTLDRARDTLTLGLFYLTEKYPEKNAFKNFAICKVHGRFNKYSSSNCSSYIFLFGSKALSLDRTEASQLESHSLCSFGTLILVRSKDWRLALSTSKQRAVKGMLRSCSSPFRYIYICNKDLLFHVISYNTLENVHTQKIIDLRALTLVGPTGKSPILDPLAVLCLNNLLYVPIIRLCLGECHQSEVTLYVLHFMCKPLDMSGFIL